MVLECRSFSLPQQFTPKYKEPGNHNSGEDMMRTCKFSLMSLLLFKRYRFQEVVQFQRQCISYDLYVMLNDSLPPIRAASSVFYKDIKMYPYVYRLVEVPVSAATGVPGSCVAGRYDWILCLPLSKPHPHPWHRSTSPGGW